MSERRITELLIDTGRRPDEICALAWDCLERDASGSPVLIYTDAKNNRPGRRLPVSEATAAVITAQKGYVRGRLPATPPWVTWCCSLATRATGTAPSPSSAAPTATPTASSPTPSRTC